MPFEIDLEGPLGGYARTYARAGESVEVCVREFTSTEDGQHFIQLLEGIANGVLQELPTPINPSQVDHMLAIYQRNGKVDVYLNELELKASTRIGRSVEAGQPVMKDDVIDIVGLDLGVPIPNDTGVLFLFSIGWRKGLFFDFGPVGKPDSLPREYDVAAAFGQAFCHVLFQERFSISDDEWRALLEAKWFPFAGLRNDTIDSLIHCVRAGWDPDENIEAIVAEVKERSPDMLESWQNNTSFEPHMEILQHAVQRFQEDDYISCTGLMFSRIEGILRTHHTSLGTSVRPKPQNLAKSAVVAKVENDKCLLLPRHFSNYLNDVYFKDFDPNDTDIEVSRHSVGHGVANVEDFNQKSAVISLLIVHQLFYLLGSEENSVNQDDEKVDVGEDE